MSSDNETIKGRREILKGILAFNIDALGNWIAFFVLLAVVLIASLAVTFMLSYIVFGIWTAIVVIVGLIIGAAFIASVQKFGGTPMLVIKDVPKNTVLVLRWRTPDNQKRKVLKYDSRQDKSLYVCLHSGLAFYSPWLFHVEGEIDMKPVVIPQQDGIKVNALDGVLLHVDCQVTIKVRDPISFMINVGSLANAQKYTQEYLETALQRVTSVTKDQLTVKLAPGDENKEAKKIEAWGSDSKALSQSTEDMQRRMGRVATSWINHWIDSKDEQRFGFEVKVKINAFKLPSVILAAQEAHAAAAEQAAERIEEARGQADALGQIVESLVTHGVPPEVSEAAAKVIADPAADPEAKKAAFQFLNSVQPNRTVLGALVTLLPGLVDIAQQFMGGGAARGLAKKEKSDTGEKAGKSA